MRRFTYLLLFFFGSLFLFSCFDDNDADSTLSSDAQIYTFSLSDTTALLENTKFSIDQINGLIFNADSLPYGTIIGNVKCNITTKNASKIIIYPEALDNEPIVWNGSDSIDFSKPVKFELYAQDGHTTKNYLAKVNVYSIKADSFVWEKISDDMISGNFLQQRTVLMPDSFFYSFVKRASAFELYCTFVKDGSLGPQKTLTNFPTNANVETLQKCGTKFYISDSEGHLFESSDIESQENEIAWAKIDQLDPLVAILGALDNDNLEIIVNNSGILSLVTFNCSTRTILQRENLPSGFPIKEFSSTNYERNFLSHLVVIGGIDESGNILNNVWTKTKYPSQTKNWFRVVGPTSGQLPARAGAICLPYDDKLMFIGGMDASGNCLKDIYFSSDQGLNWVLSDSLQVMPEDFIPRKNASAFVNDNFVFILGGEENNNILNDFWRGRIHRLAK